jgi:flagellar motor switch/type III secretory pathway protein FliN
MLMSPSLALHGLRQIAPDQAQLTQMMLALLNGERSGCEVSLVGRLAEAIDANWVICPQGVMLHIVIASGTPQIFRENRLSEMVGALDAAEPVLSEIEARTGLILDPVEAVSVLRENALIFEIASADRQHLIHLAIPPDFVAPTSLKTMFDALETDWANVPVAFEIQVLGPSLDVEAAAVIAAGDLIFIGGMVAAARLIWPLESAQTQKIIGRYDLFGGQFIANGTGVAMESGAANDMDGNTPIGFSVPISIRLPNRMARASELSAMRPGTTFNIGAVTQGLSVSILVSDQEIARGELVQVGDQFAVMIEQKIVRSEPRTGLSEADTGAE